MKTKPKNRKTALLIVVCVGLAWLGFAFYVFYELKMWVHNPAVDGQRIVYRDPDSRYGVNLHIYMPGAPDHKKKRDLEEYQELTRKWEEIHRQERMEKLRRKAEEEDPDTP